LKIWQSLEDRGYTGEAVNYESEASKVYTVIGLLYF